MKTENRKTMAIREFILTAKFIRRLWPFVALALLSILLFAVS